MERTPSPAAASPAQPACTTARTPVCRTAAVTSSPSRSPSSGAMLPKPMNTGAGPAWRKSTRSAGGCQPSGRAGHQKPATSTGAGQSTGRGASWGL
ncbi:hypothetical protein [Kitasatospora sp. NPDC127060]|uniref:hypothetical protein n=1 Tax=Kitasatospora sp. NPDC127060 TaxID=3347121 RepID=UPI00365005BC